MSNHVDVGKGNYHKYWQQLRLNVPFDIEPSLALKAKVKKSKNKAQRPLY